LEIQQFALAFRGEWAEALGIAEQAMSLLPAGSTPWFRSAGSRIVSAIYLGRPAEVLDVIRVGANLPAPSPSGPFGLSVQMLVSALLHAGAREFAVPFADRLEASAAGGIDLDPVFTGWRHTAHATLSLFMHDRIAPAVEEGKLAMRSFDSAADSLGWSIAALYTGIAHVEAGCFDVAKATLTEVAGRTERFLLPSADFAKYYLARVEALAGRTAAAEALLGAPPGIADGARGFLAEAHLQRADLEAAVAGARAIENSASCYARVTGLSVLGRVELARGRPREALEIIEKAISADRSFRSGDPPSCWLAPKHEWRHATATEHVLPSMKRGSVSCE
jgi:tetratricopeptide (TPR) repeat protein